MNVNDHVIHGYLDQSVNNSVQRSGISFVEPLSRSQKDELSSNTTYTKEDEISFFNNGKELFLEMKYNDAKYWFKLLLSHFPSNVDAWIYLGDCLDKSKEDAEYCYNSALILDPNNSEANQRKGALLRSKKPDVAFKHLQAAEETKESDPDILSDMGIALVHLQRYQEALDTFDKITSFKVLETPEVRYFQALAFHHLGRYEQASAILRSMSQNSYYAGILGSKLALLRGKVETSLGHFAAAVAAFDSVLLSESEHEEALFYRAYACMKLKQYREAIHSLTTLRRQRLEPLTFKSVRINLAKAYKRVNDETFNESLTSSRILSSSPSSSNLKDLDELKDSNGKIDGTLLFISEKIESLKEARKCYAEVRESFPHDMEVLTADLTILLEIANLERELLISRGLHSPSLKLDASDTEKTPKLDIERCIMQCNRALKTQKRADLYFINGMAHYYLMNYDKDIVSSSSTDAQTGESSTSASVETQDGLSKAAKEQFEYALHLFKNPDTLCSKAKKLQKIGFDDLAARYLEEALLIDPSHERSGCFKSEILCAKGEYQAALKLLEQLNPTPVVRLHQALCKASNDPKEAIDELSALITEKPPQSANFKFEDLLFTRGRLLSKIGDYQAALKDFELVIRREPTHLGALRHAAAISFYQLKDLEKSSVYYESILILRPNDTWALEGKARSHFYLNQFDSAITCLDKILQRNPKHQEALQLKSQAQSLGSVGGYTYAMVRGLVEDSVGALKSYYKSLPGSGWFTRK